jgi:hypothetical protein
VWRAIVFVSRGTLLLNRPTRSGTCVEINRLKLGHDLREIHADHDTPKIEGRLKFACLTVRNMASIAGKDVADSGLGRWARSQATGSKSSGFSSSPVTGHRFSDACSAFSMSRLSKRWPVFLETTGCWGTSPEMAQYILVLVFLLIVGRAARWRFGDVQARLLAVPWRRRERLLCQDL